MATHTARSSVNGRRTNSVQQHGRINRNASYAKRLQPVDVSDQNAYTYTLRTAYLNYLLQPRQKRVQHVANTSKPLVQRSSTSINDLVKDFSQIKETKSTKFPHGFMKELDKRLENVLYGKEKMPEYNDPLVKRSFADFLNKFKEESFRKAAEKDRKVEDLLLIFYARATRELQKGKAPDDDSWKLMVDRHVALFVRLIQSTLRSSSDWVRDRPELTSRLQTLETKLLQHDQDLAQHSTSVEVEVPRSYEVKDMPLVLRVGKIFNVTREQMQDTIDTWKSEWTEEAALRDLKSYQTQMMLGTGRTLSSRDFDLEDAFESWRKGELYDITQMMLAIVQSNPQLAKSTPGGMLPNFKVGSPGGSDSGYSELSKTLSSGGEGDLSYVIDQPVDMSALSLASSSPRDSVNEDVSFTFIPPDARAYYRQVLKIALSHDLTDPELVPSTPPPADGPPMKLLGPQTMAFMNEVALRWRIPQFSRLVLFLDVIREKLQNQELGLETVDNAFLLAKEPLPEPKKGSLRPPTQVDLWDRSKWTITDYALNRSILSSMHDSLLRELFDTFQHCYENKAPSIGPIMYNLDAHIYSDDLFSKSPEDLDAFTVALSDAIRQKAKDKYSDLIAKNVPDDAEKWEFFNIIQLGKAVVGLCEKIQKRYRKNPEVMSVNPLRILVEEILPSFAADARHIVERIIEVTKSRGEEVPIQDGFDLYKELVSIRQVHAAALPNVEFGFHIEGLLQEFVWRWIAMTDAKLVDWIEAAVAHDDFAVRVEHAGNIPTDDERHSQSAVDVFRIFNQSIDQISKLEWDDDLQYARFMTAMSKSVGNGIARYCELVEKKFAKEMDRQTPEQEAAAQRTRQEKWLAMAKDTWNQKEKIDPFNFYPESFVKLNNIEYATLQLDKLEKEVNVDACAEVINRLDPPPPPRMRGQSKYVFTIKIIEAEDLKACDMNGLSDPYVVLGDEYQKRLAKTRIVYSNLNPRWDETVDITTQGPLNIIATIWDWDTLGDHDCVGRTSLKLDPSHFNDYMPREYWLDLDTQGRLLLRVSMEGERDDIQFYFGKAFRLLRRTEKDMTRKITDKLSSYIQQCLSRRALRGLLNQGIQGMTVNSVRNYFNRTRPQSVQPSGPTPIDISGALKPLFTYFDDNFAIMKQTLTDSAMVLVMTKLWKEVLATIESLLVPPLSDKISQQRQLTQQEMDVVFKWLQVSLAFLPISPCGTNKQHRCSLTSSTPSTKKRAKPMASRWIS